MRAKEIGIIDGQKLVAKCGSKYKIIAILTVPLSEFRDYIEKAWNLDFIAPQPKISKEAHNARK